MIRVGLFLLLSCGISVEAFAGAFTFSGIGTLPGAVGSSSSGISADGKTIVGRSTKAGQSPQGFIWTAETGMHPAGPSTQRSVAIRGVSGDGSVVVGTEEISDTNALPFYWSNATGVVSFGQNLGASRSNSAWAASGDGSVIVGVGVNSKAMYEGYRWTEVGGFQWLGDLPGGRFESDARAVSYDGSVIVGSSSYSTTGWQAYRWTAGSGMVGLGLLPGASNSYAIDVSSDGRIVVGMSGFLSYIWREETGMVPLDSRLLGSAPGWLGAGSLSDDGRVVGGASLMGGGLHDECRRLGERRCLLSERSLDRQWRHGQNGWSTSDSLAFSNLGYDNRLATNEVAPRCALAPLRKRIACLSEPLIAEVR